MRKVVAKITLPLASIRTDGWFQQIASEIDDFDAIARIIGERVFAFTMILGVRITSLLENPRNPEATVVDFIIDDESVEAVRPQQLSLFEFRQRLVSALLSSEAAPPPPTSANDTEGLKRYIGIRYLLLAPLYGYSLDEIVIGDDVSTLYVMSEGQRESFEIEAFRERIREHLEDDLDAHIPSQEEGAIDLARVALAEEAASSGNWRHVIDLLRSWPEPLSYFLRTPEGQSIDNTTRALLAQGLGLYASASIHLGNAQYGEDIFRLAIQYANGTAVAGEIFQRMGEAMLDGGRDGEAIAPLRRALSLGAAPDELWPLLARAFANRGKYVAALASVEEAKRAGATDLESVEEAIEEGLGESLAAYRGHMLGQSS